MKNEEKYWENTNTTTLLNHLIVKYQKWIQKHTSNKMVPVYIISEFLKNSGQKMVVTQIEKERYYGKIINNHYLTQYVIMADIGNRFRNVQGIKQYQLILFLLCL